MKQLISLCIAMMLLLSIGGAVIASDISNAEYYGDVRVTNNGTVASNVATTISGINTTSMVTGGFLNSDADDSTILHSGSDVVFMPGYEPGPWIMWVSSIGALSYYDDKFYTPNVTDPKIAYFPGDSGMTVSDDASLESGASTFSVNLTGYIDTSAGNGKYIFWHGDNFTAYVSDATSGTLDVLVGNVTLTTAGISSGAHTIIVTLE